MMPQTKLLWGSFDYMRFFEVPWNCGNLYKQDGLYGWRIWDAAGFKHKSTFQGVAAEQQAEIKRLRNEINRLSMFRSTVRNYQVH